MGLFVAARIDSLLPKLPFDAIAAALIVVATMLCDDWITVPRLVLLAKSMLHGGSTNNIAMQL